MDTTLLANNSGGSRGGTWMACPHLIFRPNWGPMGGKKFFLEPPLIWRSGWLPPPPAYLKVWIWHWTIPNIVGCYMLYPFAYPVACCCVLLGVVMQSLKSVKLLSLQLPTFVLFCDCQSISNNVGSVCTALPTMFGPHTCITHYTWLT